jgi:hypothetical protein
MLSKNVIAVIIVVGLIFIIGAFALLGLSQTVVLETIQAGNSVAGWEISDSFKAGETLILEITSGSDWGKLLSGSSESFPVQLNVTLRVTSGEEANFSCWYNALPETSTGMTPATVILEPANVTVIENNASRFLEAARTPYGEVGCLVKTDVNVTAGLDKDSVLNNFGPVQSPPELRIVKDISTYPYSYLFPVGLLSASVGLVSLAYGVYALRRGKRRRRIRRREMEQLRKR